MARYVISDASPLIGLAIVDGLDWLPALFGTVWIPPSVQREVLPATGARGETEIALAIKNKHITFWRQKIPTPPLNSQNLDQGEVDCICLALAQPAGQAIVLIDERAGRAIANEYGIPVAGTVQRRLIQCQRNVPNAWQLHWPVFSCPLNDALKLLRFQ